MFVGEGDPTARDGRPPALDHGPPDGFRVDANLRPEGRTGRSSARSTSYEAYWERWAAAVGVPGAAQGRTVAGDPEVGEGPSTSPPQGWRVFEPRRPALAAGHEGPGRGRGGPPGPDRPRGEAGPGGIRDIEFAVQLLQLVHGRLDPDSGPRPRSTPSPSWPAAATSMPTTPQLADAYRFLRRVEHRLQLEDEQQTHTLPADRNSAGGPRPRLPGQPRGTHRAFDQSTPPAAQPGPDRSTSGCTSGRCSSRSAGTRGLVSPEAAERPSPASGSPTVRAPGPRWRADPGLHPDVAADAADACRWCSTGCSESPDPDLGLLNCASWPTASRGRSSWPALPTVPEVARRLCRCSGPAGCWARSWWPTPS